MSRPEEQLACAIARHHFGPIVGEVVRLLLLQPGSSSVSLITDCDTFFSKQYNQHASTSTSTSTVIKSSTAPSASQRPRLIRDALTVLIQHDLAYARQQHGTNSGPAPFDYFVFIDKLMCRSRIPLYIGFARQRFGTVGDVALRTLFERGRLTSHMIFKLALDSALPKLSLSVSQAEACLTDMTRSGLLHWSCRRFQRRKAKRSNDQQNGNDSTSTCSKIGTKRSRPLDDSDDDSDDSVEPINGGMDSDSSSESIEDGQIMVGRGESRRKVGAPTRDNNTDVWTVCYWHLNKEFRNECCVKVAQMRLIPTSDFVDATDTDDNNNNNNNQHGMVACAILRIGLQLALEQEDCLHPSEEFETTDILMEDIQKILEERDDAVNNNNGSTSAFWEAAQLLINQSPSFVLPIPDHAPIKLRFIPGRLIAEARQKTLDEFIATRYQPVGRRIFRALAIDGGMEEKMLAEKCMMHVKVVRAIIYKLYEDDLLGLQEVSRSSHDQQRSSNWYYLWTVNLMAAMRTVVQIMYKTSCNLFLRLDNLDRQQREQHGGIIPSAISFVGIGTGMNSEGGGVSSGSASGGGGGGEERGKKSKLEEERRRLMAQRMILVGNILRMDQSIMVMRDFGPLTSSYFPSKYTMIDGPVGIVRKRPR